jgi:plastocyanin
MSRAPRTPSRRPWTTLSALTAVLLFAAAGILPAVGTAPGGSAVPAATASNTWINLTLTNALAFVPTNPSSSTMAVTFEVRNTDPLNNHTFTLSSRVNATAPSGSAPDNVTGDWFSAPYVSRDVQISPGSVAFVNITFPTAGTYQFICRYHFPAMSGLVTVSSGSSSSSSSPSYLLYGATGAIVLIIVVVATVVYLGRRKPKAPVPPPAAPPT